MESLAGVRGVTIAALLVALAAAAAYAQADSSKVDSTRSGTGKSGTGKKGKKASTARVEARLWLGHDSNLLDLSEVDRESFETGNPLEFFAVDRMSDQFAQGEVGIEWEPPRPAALRPTLSLAWERRQYFFNPIKTEDQFAAGLATRPAKGTRVDLQAAFRPQVYNRHRFYFDALPGEPRFRAEAYRRWDGELRLRQAMARSFTADGRLEASTRRYRPPFEGRDRRSFGGGGGLSRALGRDVTARGAVRYRATWTRNDPWDPDDRSHRTWQASTGIEVGKNRFLKAVRLDLDLEWRRFTSTNPDDEDHFGRRDRGGEVQLELVRALSRSLDWASRATWRWRNSDVPAAALDEDGPFEEAVFRTGVRWDRKL